MNATSTLVREIETRERSATGTMHTTIDADSEVETLQMRLLISSPREWPVGYRGRVYTAPEYTPRQRHSRGSRELSNIGESHNDSLVVRSHHATTSGAHVQQYDGSSANDIQVGRQAQFKPTVEDGPSSDETSGHWTIRKRTVGIAEACDWDNLQSELRKSIYSHLLLPDELAKEEAQAQSPRLNGASVKIPQAASELFPPLRELLKPPNSPPRLRKVCSSPSLHSAFEQVSVTEGHAEHNAVGLPVLLHSSSAPMFSRIQTQSVDSTMGDALNDGQTPMEVGSLPRRSVSNEAGTEDARMSSHAFSFDQTRRTTLDVVNRPIEADSRTLDGYEAESIIDVEASNRDSSEMTAFSTQCNEDDVNDASPSSRRSEEPKSQSSNENDDPTRGVYSLRPDHRSSSVDETLSSQAHIASTKSVQSVGDPAARTDRFATVGPPKRRYTFPSTEKGVDLKSELDRKFNFRFAQVKEKADIPDKGMRGPISPLKKRKTTARRTSGAQILKIAKTRAPKSSKDNVKKKKIQPRKLTPYKTWDEQLSSHHNHRRAIPRDWKTLSQLSEAASLLSENDIPLHKCHGANSWYHGLAAPSRDASPEQSHLDVPASSNSVSNRITLEDITRRSNATVSSSRCVTPEQLLDNTTSLSPVHDRPQTPPLSIWSTHDDASILRLTPVHIADRDVSTSFVLMKTQVRTGGSPIKRAFTVQSSAEKAKRRESMKRAGRLLEDRNHV